MRLRRTAASDPDVPMTPLIDCVFLLIVFFLVTSMFKRWEMIVPVRLPDATSSISESAQETVVLVGVHRDGSISVGERTSENNEPIVRYQQVADLETLLDELAKTRGAEAALVIAVHRDLPMQELIKTVDAVQLRGFTNVTVQTSERLGR